MVFVSHSMPDVMDLCDRVLWIEKHLMRMIGKTSDVVEEYTKTDG